MLQNKKGLEIINKNIACINAGYNSETFKQEYQVTNLPLVEINHNDNKIITATNELNLILATDKLIGWENLIVDGIELDFNKALLDDIDIVDELVELGNYIYIVSKYPNTKIEY